MRLVENVPLYKTGDGQISTGYSMTSLEKTGLLKMDFLGLRTLTVIHNTIRLIKKSKGVEIVLDEIPLDLIAQITKFRVEQGSERLKKEKNEKIDPFN